VDQAGRGREIHVVAPPRPGQQSIPGLRLPLVGTSMDRVAARSVATADRALADRVVMDRDIRTREGEVRVPVERDESVVLKRGEGGHDEIIIRRPLDERGDRAG